jgi:hypothetical protein
MLASRGAREDNIIRLQKSMVFFPLYVTRSEQRRLVRDGIREKAWVYSSIVPGHAFLA